MTNAASNLEATPVDGQPKPVIVLAGPTASGKSRVALAVAEAFDGTIINADALQVYRELSILTARPGDADLARAPHRLYGFLAGDQVCSAGIWRDRALEEIAKVHEAGRLPLVVGGTGLYLRALMRGLSALPDVPDAVRRSARQRLQSLGPAGLHAELAARDPVMAARLRPSDSQRLVRAWEVFEATGRSLADWQAEVEAPDPALRFQRLVLLPPRAELYARCDARFLAMLEQGALAEVEALLRLGYPPVLPVMKSLGVPQLAAVLEGRLSREEAISGAQQATRNFAKRQMTWLRGQLPKDRPASESAPQYFANSLVAQESERLITDICKNIRNFLLTVK